MSAGAERTPAAGAPQPGAALSEALRAGAARLAAAGIASPRVDVELLAAHLLGVDRGGVQLASLRGDPAPDGLDALLARRAERVPLQHLTGSAPFRRLELAVGPGVFVPRPETEQVAQVAIDEARRVASSTGAVRVVDLCTGSGAIAIAVADEVPTAVVHAVELDASAHAWASQNVARLLAGARVVLVRGDARTALGELDGTVDVVVSNPPYIPPDAVPVDPEVRDHDPGVALYGLGSDGLAVPRGIVAAAARLLAPGGLLVMEHAEVQAAAARTMLHATGRFGEIGTRTDLGGRERMVVGRRTHARGRA
ncbi:peptide chain release factor N(5)-glutamine methyltransferase [Actinotalea sp.]|uniref:peptide chain release factor N(5)-glutamine methyltransferase n=1 Tax=Actinotalea sp. TaxID=1872145 RepID=UPI003569DBCC